MIITCPICLIKFNLDDERIPEGGAKARCSKCQHVFPVQKPAPGGETSPPAETPSPIFAEDFSPRTPRKVEMPPRKKPPPRRIPALVFLIIMLALAGVGYGGYLVWKSPEAKKKIALSFSTLKKYLGLGGEAEGFISLEKVRGYYLDNKNLNGIFVIEGQAVNQWKEPRSFIKVKGTLLNPKGEKVEEKTSFCGNILLEEDLKIFTRDTIEKSLSSQFGETFSNVNIQPGKSVPFMIVFTGFHSRRTAGQPDKQPAAKPGAGPSGITDFSVEVVSSQKGSGDKGPSPSSR
ncbi:MAG: DUF3426 domain-containing protein [Deltaproteobacteria bacterium]|nr:DUF3426 domain-containing protein [Deltaproteobacteria bacterium]